MAFPLKMAKKTMDLGLEKKTHHKLDATRWKKDPTAFQNS
jgi:hypothetical protein